MLSKFGTRIFHANSSRQTNQFAAELIGKVEKFHIGRSQSRGSGSGGGGNRHDAGGTYQGHDSANVTRSTSSSGYLDWELPPDYFSKELRIGTSGHRFKVDGIVVRTGRSWRKTKKHWIKAEFDQRCRAPGI